MPAHECNRYHALPLALPLGLCFCRWMWCCFVLCKVGTIIMTVAINALPAEPMHFYALEVLASCSTRRVRLHFVLCKVSSTIMTVAINAHYLPLVDFYAPALLASRFFLRLLRPAMLAHQIMTNPFSIFYQAIGPLCASPRKSTHVIPSEVGGVIQERSG
jgi:hypothetical protein